jgi:hypothetical protein
MTGTLTYAAAFEHINDLHAAAEKGRRAPRKPRRELRLPALPGLRRPRRAFA